MKTIILTLDDGFYEDFLDAAESYFIQKDGEMPVCKNGLPIPHHIEAWFRYQWYRNTGYCIVNPNGINLDGKELHVLTHEACSIYVAELDVQILELIETHPLSELRNYTVELADLSTIILREQNHEQ